MDNTAGLRHQRQWTNRGSGCKFQRHPGCGRADPTTGEATATRLSPVESFYPDGRDRWQQLLHRDRDAVGAGSARRNDCISAQQQWDRARAEQNPGEAGLIEGNLHSYYFKTGGNGRRHDYGESWIVDAGDHVDRSRIRPLNRP